MLKKIFVPLMLSVSCALLLTACGGSDTTSNNTTTTNNTGTTKTTTSTTTSTPTTTTTTTTSSPTTTTTSSPTTTASSGDKVGVPECDDYLAKMEACLAKLPAAAKDTYNKAFDQTRTAWRNAAATPQGKAGLAQGCKAATDQMKTSMKAYNCDF